MDGRKLFNETQLQLIHAGLVKLCAMDEGLSDEDMKAAGELVERVEELVPESAEGEHSNVGTIGFGSGPER